MDSINEQKKVIIQYVIFDLNVKTINSQKKKSICPSKCDKLP